MVKTKNREGSILFDIVIYAIAIFAVFITIIPIIRIISMSISSQFAVSTGQIFILPKQITLEAINFIFSQAYFRNSFVFTVGVTVASVLVSLSLTILMAYPLSKKNFPARRFILLGVVFTMLFNGGIIPHYLIIKELGLLNKIPVLIIPIAINPFNLIVLINFFKGIPASMEESAKIDGAGNFRILIQILLPLLKAALATLTLFYAVSRWNGWFDALMFYRNKNMNMIQIMLRDMILMTNPEFQQQLTSFDAVAVATAQVQSAAIVLSTLPIVIIYPFLQKHFVKGVALGAIKG